ncbi:hypothetical protein [Blastococcus tunisiensis]|uniref:hypothetical protein n=1 Tax=Blastococcus tunisiensis TaxID=1798228 RepID=UPI0011140609|nr:hypothetical protein [Blastococcus sp. DSM 46838]
MDETQQIDNRVYTAWQRTTYVPPLCPACGTALIPQWLDVEAAGPNRMFRLTYAFCCNSCEDR